MKNVKSILTMAALALGVGVGFGVAFTPAEAEAAVECRSTSQCDSMKVCGAPDAVVCEFGRCVCFM